jgi:hypothetical protein
MNSLGLLLRIREAFLAARSDFGGTSSSLATLLLRLFVSYQSSPLDYGKATRERWEASSERWYVEPGKDLLFRF